MRKDRTVMAPSGGQNMQNPIWAIGASIGNIKTLPMV